MVRIETDCSRTLRAMLSISVCFSSLSPLYIMIAHATIIDDKPKNAVNDDDGEFDDEGRLYAVIPINQSVREVSLFRLWVL